MPMAADHYESQSLLDEYLLFHYGESIDQLPWAFGPQSAVSFPRRCVTETLDLEQLPANARALEVGCAVGRACFELSAFCSEVIGVDASKRFIAAAEQLVITGTQPYQIKETGHIVRQAEARVPAHARPERVRFLVGDALALPQNLGTFDVMLACNLLCRLPDPNRFLQSIPALVRPGGQLVVSTPHSWLERFTVPEYWLGATPETGEPFEAIRAVLEPAFQLQRRCDLPFLIREHRRKYQWSVAEVTVWIRS